LQGGTTAGFFRVSMKTNFFNTTFMLIKLN
jgi:hypothetical protein